MILESSEPFIVSRDYPISLYQKPLKSAKICDIKKLKNNPRPKTTFSVTYYQTLKEVFWPLRLIILINDKCQNKCKKLQDLSKKLKILMLKCWNSIKLEIVHNLLSNPRDGSFALEPGET